MLADRWRGGFPSCTCVVNGFESISSFLDSFRNSLHDGFLQISTNSSYPIPSRRRGKHASQIYPRMKKVYGEQCLARCTIFRWCQRYEAGRVKIKDNVTNSAMILAYHRT
ncbi:hypothetical protein AVEN_238106-1 [Araneus ventricosus]|uniref:Mos1 transposase HTH domain-containing protein n=1 Tax=Araneus ventricosus TaxID=182803 RepID=A0A4Y2GF67_ARAVE|nr:hypothetical protein AVEN_238106-1 [Araneus ventricosus]